MARLPTGQHGRPIWRIYFFTKNFLTSLFFPIFLIYYSYFFPISPYRYLFIFHSFSHIFPIFIFSKKIPNILFFYFVFLFFSQILIYIGHSIDGHQATCCNGIHGGLAWHSTFLAVLVPGLDTWASTARPTTGALSNGLCSSRPCYQQVMPY